MFGRKLSLAKKEQFASYMQVVMSYFGHESESEIDIDFETSTIQTFLIHFCLTKIFIKTISWNKSELCVLKVL